MLLEIMEIDINKVSFTFVYELFSSVNVVALFFR